MTQTRSGDKRQPRLQDIERLEKEVNELRGLVKAQTEQLRQNPFAGMDGVDFMWLVAAGFAAGNKINVSEKLLFQRGRAMANAFGIWKQQREEPDPDALPWVAKAKSKKAQKEEVRSAQRAKRTELGKGAPPPMAAPVPKIEGAVEPALIPND